MNDRYDEGDGDANVTSGILGAGEYLLISEVDGLAFSSGLDGERADVSATASAELTLSPAP